MGAVFKISCRTCKKSLDMSKAGFLAFELIKKASESKDSKDFTAILSKEIEKLFPKTYTYDDTTHHIYWLTRAILFILEHSGHDLVMWRDEGFIMLDIKNWKNKKLEYEPLPDELWDYKKE